MNSTETRREQPTTSTRNTSTPAPSSSGSGGAVRGALHNQSYDAQVQMLTPNENRPPSDEGAAKKLGGAASESPVTRSEGATPDGSGWLGLRGDRDATLGFGQAGSAKRTETADGMEYGADIGGMLLPGKLGKLVKLFESAVEPIKPIPFIFLGVPCWLEIKPALKCGASLLDGKKKGAKLNIDLSGSIQVGGGVNAGVQIGPAGTAVLKASCEGSAAWNEETQTFDVAPLSGKIAWEGKVGFRCTAGDWGYEVSQMIAGGALGSFHCGVWSVDVSHPSLKIDVAGSLGKVVDYFASKQPDAESAWNSVKEGVKDAVSDVVDYVDPQLLPDDTSGIVDKDKDKDPGPMLHIHGPLPITAEGAQQQEDEALTRLRTRVQGEFKSRETGIKAAKAAAQQAASTCNYLNKEKKTIARPAVAAYSSGFAQLQAGDKKWQAAVAASQAKTSEGMYAFFTHAPAALQAFTDAKTRFQEGDALQRSAPAE